jgi:hypothetical protein
MRLLIISLFILSLGYSKGIIKGEQEYPLDKFKEQNSQIIKMVVSEISKDLPQKVDKYTTMTNIRDENLTLIYTFEINTGSKSDEAVIKDDKYRMQKAVTKGVCQSSKRFLDANISLAYEYKSAISKKELFTFFIDKQKCKELKYD